MNEQYLHAEYTNALRERDEARQNFNALQKALVGETGLSGIEVATALNRFKVKVQEHLTAFEKANEAFQAEAKNNFGEVSHDTRWARERAALDLAFYMLGARAITGM